MKENVYSQEFSDEVLFVVWEHTVSAELALIYNAQELHLRLLRA